MSQVNTLACDRCRKGPGHPTINAVDSQKLVGLKGKPLVIDTCRKHRAEFLRVIRPFLCTSVQADGRRTRRKSAEIRRLALKQFERGAVTYRELRDKGLYDAARALVDDGLAKRLRAGRYVLTSKGKAARG